MNVMTWESQMAKVTGKATGHAGKFQVLLTEALQDALANAPPPPAGNDVLQLKLIDLRIEHGGFVLSTTTRVTLEIL